MTFTRGHDQKFARERRPSIEDLSRSNERVFSIGQMVNESKMGSDEDVFVMGKTHHQRRCRQLKTSRLETARDRIP